MKKKNCAQQDGPMWIANSNLDLDQSAGNLDLIYFDLILHPGVIQKLCPPFLFKHLNSQPH